jgi:hypothetical protein
MTTMRLREEYSGSIKKCVSIRTLSAKSVFSFGHPKSGFALTAARDTAFLGERLYII